MKRIAEKIKTWWEKIFKKSLDFIRPTVIVAIEIVDIIKDMVNDPTADVVVNLTNTKWDNVVLAFLREGLPAIAKQLHVTGIVLESNPTNNEIITALINWLRQQNHDVQAAFYIMLAGKINAALQDGKIDIAEAVSLGQIVWKELQQNNGK